MTTPREERLAYNEYLRAKRERVEAGASAKLEWIEKVIMIELDEVK